jgi:hypothetical protein
MLLDVQPDGAAAEVGDQSHDRRSEATWALASTPLQSSGSPPSVQVDAESRRDLMRGRVRESGLDGVEDVGVLRGVGASVAAEAPGQRGVVELNIGSDIASVGNCAGRLQRHHAGGAAAGPTRSWALAAERAR